MGDYHSPPGVTRRSAPLPPFIDLSTHDSPADESVRVRERVQHPRLASDKVAAAFFPSLNLDPCSNPESEIEAGVRYGQFTYTSINALELATLPPTERFSDQSSSIVPMAVTGASVQESITHITNTKRKRDNDPDDNDFDSELMDHVPFLDASPASNNDHFEVCEDIGGDFIGLAAFPRRKKTKAPGKYEQRIEGEWSLDDAQDLGELVVSLPADFRNPARVMNQILLGSNIMVYEGYTRPTPQAKSEVCKLPDNVLQSEGQRKQLDFRRPHANSVCDASPFRDGSIPRGASVHPHETISPASAFQGIVTLQVQRKFWRALLGFSQMPIPEMGSSPSQPSHDTQCQQEKFSGQRASSLARSHITRMVVDAAFWRHPELLRTMGLTSMHFHPDTSFVELAEDNGSIEFAFPFIGLTIKIRVGTSSVCSTTDWQHSDPQNRHYAFQEYLTFNVSRRPMEVALYVAPTNGDEPG
ncbi:hypothetical protein DFJ77DRAFT_550444 [Powellomyces hirtus]|nr:hypothetical protein DFJ77DRAFT_550444 [Powellomyces hirtus]